MIPLSKTPKYKEGAWIKNSTEGFLANFSTIIIVKGGQVHHKLSAELFSNIHTVMVL